MTDLDRALYANHRQFLQAQRGPLTRHDGFDVIHGDVPAFQIAMLHEAEAVEQAKAGAAFVFAPPWADPGLQPMAGLAYQLAYMTLPAGVMRSPQPVSGLVVKRVDNDAQLRAFTEVQAAGFADAPEGYDELFAWMWDKNVRAFPLSDQDYFCLRRNDAVVSVLLTVDSGDALGIYAVATPPALRKQGLSSHLLGHVCAKAPAAKQICLQVVSGSDAERLYTKLGFVREFVVNVYKSR